MNLKGLLTGLFGPITVAALLRFLQIGDSIIGSAQPLKHLVTPEGHMPIVLLLITYSVAVLARLANDSYVEQHPQTPLTGKAALFAYGSAGCIVLMLLFCLDVKRFPWWLGSYAILCFVNAGWNYVAVAEPESRPHVKWNVVLGFVLMLMVLVSVFWRFSTTWWFIYLTVVGALGIKWWQRRNERQQFLAT
jgi:hypothetical protein